MAVTRNKNIYFLCVEVQCLLNKPWQTAQRELAKDLKAWVWEVSTRLCARQGSTLNGSLLDKSVWSSSSLIHGTNSFLRSVLF